MNPPDAECKSPSDCAGKTAALDCAGDWTCRDGGCVWECRQSPDTTLAPKPECSVPSDCQGGIPRRKCPGLWKCTEGRCEWECIKPTTTSMQPERRGITLESFSQGPCPQDYADKRYRNEVSLEKTQTRLLVTHQLDYVCCANITVSLEVAEEESNTIISLMEKNIGGFCRCICGYNVTATISGIESGKDYFVRVYGVEYRGNDSGFIREVSTDPRVRGEGGFCGGIAGIACREGLECRLEGGFPDAGGRCETAGTEG